MACCISAIPTNIECKPVKQQFHFVGLALYANGLPFGIITDHIKEGKFKMVRASLDPRLSGLETEIEINDVKISAELVKILLDKQGKKVS